MKLIRLALAFAVIFVGNFIHAQTAPNYENGWKPFGSYDGSHLDTVNLMNGNLMLHAPIVPDVPQRGALTLSDVIYTSSKNWQAVCTPNTDQPNGMLCLWKNGGSQLQIQTSVGITVKRTLETIFLEGTPTYYATYGYSLTSMDGATHSLRGVPSSNDANGYPTVFDSIDLTGYHLVMSNPDANGVTGTFTVTDRRGVQYQGSTFVDSARCGRIPETSNNLPPAGGHAPMIDDSSGGPYDCAQTAYAELMTDSNGNQMNVNPRTASSNVKDTLGRIPQLFFTVPTYNAYDQSGCVSSHPFYVANMLEYAAPDGSMQSIKLCYALLPVQTAFNQMADGGHIGEFTSTADNPYAVLTTIVLANGTKWTFDYDTYGELSFIGLPTGGSISYTWTTINFANCDIGNVTPVSRAVATRTLNDGQGHIEQWSYNWGTAGSSGLTNVVTDPLGNDTVHIFTAQIPPGLGQGGACSLYESSTIAYQGPQGANHPLQRVDTTYTSALYTPSAGIGVIAGIGSVFATDIATTVYPSGKVKKIHKDPDAGPGGGAPLFGNVKKELEYDWGTSTTPGPLLRETDTTYQWETNSAYLTAHLLDLPASVVVKNGSGNRVAETDYTYDEASYLTASGVTTQHGAPPNGVRGNQSTVSHWLNTTNGFISSHTNWYDTGEVYQKTDPLGHTTTYSYDPAYAGAYATETCSPTTNSVVHCVSGTYDFNTGVLTSLTNENATAQASGNAPGDSAHTSTYSYDFMFRLTSGQAPPDPANGSARATNSFTFSAPGSLPLSVQRTKSVTNALNDSATSFFDGLGRSYTSQHVLPNGTAKVDTTFDIGGHVATVTNPYFSTSDPTYGITTNAYDGMDRVTQVTKQDGSISSVSYNVAVSIPGNCTDTVDEAGHQRRTCSDALGRLIEVDEPNPGAAATAAQATITLNGVEQANPLPAIGGSGSVIISGTEGTSRVCSDPEPPAHPVCHNVPDGGTIGLKVGTYTPVYMTYGSGSTGATLASALQQGFHNDPSSPVDAAIDPANSTKINFTARGTGVATNYPLTFYNDVDFSVNSFGGLTTLTGGRDASSSPDTGTVTVLVNGTSYSTTYGGSDTGATIAMRLATAISAGTFANASTSGNVLTLTAKSTGQGGDYAYTASSTYDSAHFAGPSFTLSSTSGSMANGYSAGNVGNQPLVTLYQYDALGNLLRVDQKGTAPSDSTQWRTRTFTYDSLSRLLTANNPESGTISYSYDADGNLLQKTSPAANQTGSATQTVSYCYDELHRVTGKGYGAQSCPLSSPVVSYAYDSGANAKGKLVSLIDQAGTASYTYDTLGRLTGETRTLTGANNAAVSKNLAYSYNLDGSLKSLTYPSGAVVTYTPDSAGRTLSAVDGGNGINYATGATYGPDGSLTGFVSGNSGTFAGITSVFSYNKRLQPVNMSATAPSQTLYSVGYDFHMGNGTTGADNGNVFGIYNYRDRDRDQTFTYDALNRLVSAQNAGTDCTAATVNSETKYWGNSYSYDAWGNLLQKSITKCGAENLQVTADAHNWIHASGTDYQYDAAGNMTYDATASLNYTFDQENRITGAGGYTYTYDGDGNRVEKVNGLTGTLYWHMTPGIVAETDLAGTLKSEYVVFAGKRVARKDFLNNTVAYYFSDNLKTAAVITDSTGNITDESDYYPWGGELQFTNNDSNHYKFTGKERDGESSLDYFGARYYSNGLGRWVSADWSSTPVPVPYADFGDPQSLNLYGYVRNAPSTSTDINGHFWQQVKNLFGPAGCWCTDDKAQAKIEQMRADLVNWGARFDGKTPDYKSLSPRQVSNYWHEFDLAAKAFNQQQQQQAQQFAFLRFLHGKDTLSNIDNVRKMSTEDIINSLKPGSNNPESLQVKMDGTVMNGNTRLRVLEERGIDIQNLPRDIHTTDPVGPSIREEIEEIGEEPIL